jgi:hypothetical protein
MSDRLQELLRQKALLAEQAAGLERKIAAEEAKADVNPSATGLVTAAPPPVSADAAVAALLDEYRPDPHALQQSVKRGCYLYFLGAVTLLGLGVLAIYIVYRHR